MGEDYEWIKDVAIGSLRTAVRKHAKELGALLLLSQSDLSVLR